MIDLAFRYTWNWFTRPPRARKQTGYPTVLNLPITDNCNSRCVMCDVWKTSSVDELSAPELGKILSDPLFSRIEHAGISGGEPTLRSDLVQIVDVLTKSCTSLRSLSITSHGFHSSRWERFLPQIREICRSRSVEFVLNLSLDGVGELHDLIRQIPGGYGRVIKTYQFAKGLGVRVKFQSTISQPNVYGIANILETASDFRASVDFRVATEIQRLDNIESMKNVALNPNEKSFFADFLVSRQLLQSTKSPARRLFYRDLARRLVFNTPRKAPCHYQREGVLLTSHGDLYHCSISRELLGNLKNASPSQLYFSAENESHRKKLIQKTCPSCLHDQSGAWHPAELFLEVFRQNKVGGQVGRLLNALPLLLKSAIHIFNLMLPNSKVLINKQMQLKKIVCIGMYGGEHVGDAAILGGVLLRLHKKYGVEEAFVSSFRADRTRRWVESLHLPVKVKIFSTEDIDSYIEKCDALVLAGGPVMDLPEVLLQQIIAVSRSNALHIPFIMEGVGIGPFRSRVTQWLARLIFRRATAITVRGIDDSTHKLVRDLTPKLAVDPAFDYINNIGESSRDSLSKEEYHSPPFIDSHEKRFKVGLNLRPFWQKYNFSQQSNSDLQDIFLLSFAEALLETSQKLPLPADFSFFPMNADQFGFSDFQMIFKLKRLLPHDFPLYIWEAEPDIVPLLRFIKRMDVVVAMRFHAAIFAMSQNIPVVGIDYTIGRDGKVSKLLQESGHAESVCRVDSFDKNWFTQRLLDVVDKSSRIYTARAI